ncbi:MAG: hypothetical protein IT449_02950 [Phycisphaerales bacterium]|nr:hypothetical protein [Phycisphaerales bacterium]
MKGTAGMSETLKLEFGGDAMGALESLSGATTIVLPSGHRVWACPEEDFDDLCSVLTDPQFRAALEAGLQDSRSGRFVELSSDQISSGELPSVAE